MFEQNKIRNQPSLVCKILMNIWYILLLNKSGLWPLSQVVSRNILFRLFLLEESFLKNNNKTNKNNLINESIVY